MLAALDTTTLSLRTFAIITTDCNELVAEIHDRMPLILAPGDYARWLSDEPDPRDLMQPFPAEPMPDVADIDAGQQTGERRRFNRRAGRTGFRERIGPTAAKSKFAPRWWHSAPNRW